MPSSCHEVFFSAKVASHEGKLLLSAAPEVHFLNDMHELQCVCKITATSCSNADITAQPLTCHDRILHAHCCSRMFVNRSRRQLSSQLLSAWLTPTSPSVIFLAAMHLLLVLLPWQPYCALACGLFMQMRCCQQSCSFLTLLLLQPLTVALF